MKQPMLDAPAAEWLVYGDALQVAGDPRGELIGLVHAVAEGRATPEQRDAYVAKHAEALLGHAARHLDVYGLEWRHCLLDRIEVRIAPGADASTLVIAILQSPVASEVRELALVGVPEPKQPIDLSRAMDSLARHRPASLTSFAFVDRRAENAAMLVAGYFDPEPNLVSFGSFAPFFAFAEAIRIVTADSHQLPLENIVAPALRSFTLDSLRFADGDEAGTMCDRLASASWPALESFACRLVETFMANLPLEDNPYVSVYAIRATSEDEDERDDRYPDEAEEGESEGVNWDALNDLLANLARCPLRRLALTSFHSARSLIETLAAASLPHGLELDLSDSALATGDLDLMLRSANLLKTIKKLVIRRIAIADGDLPKYVAALEQRGVLVEASGGGSDARYRFVVGQE